MNSDITNPSAHSIHIDRAVTLAADADAIWAVVGDLADTTITEGLAERVEVDGDGVGAVRRFFLPGGVSIAERVERFDSTDRSYTYRIFDFGPLPFTDYLGFARVVPAGPGSALLSWSATARPFDGADEAARAMIAANIDHALSALARRFGTAEPR
ncbi:SRPBCC family protein [Sphingomonas colocasiae]|uniref:SRPBCC family protein n=1 Tax=Sphingomonas colocasiae TaxID=1848973 RepID=A0ABS7PSC9_9SPHN|nr:SRPBCC family protein [Sphingomonas colocasiae]MBY8824244.1 SRPBCC family protein [Sphingomonas colocasiae]